MNTSNYYLAKEEYTWGNALLWGNCAGHFKKAATGSLGSRAVHLAIACVELLPLIGQIASIFEKCIAASHFQTILMAERTQRAESIMNDYVLKHPTAKALYEQANALPTYGKSQPWKLKLVDKPVFKENECKSSACCLYEERVIEVHLEPTLAPNSEDFFIFFQFLYELKNALSFEKYNALCTLAENDQITCEDFAKEIERFEYENADSLDSTVLPQVFTERGLLPRSTLSARKPFEEAWDTIKSTPHAERYREKWRQLHARGEHNRAIQAQFGVTLPTAKASS